MRNPPDWLRGIDVDFAVHSNHGRSDGSRPYIFSLTLDVGTSCEHCRHDKAEHGNYSCRECPKGDQCRMFSQPTESWQLCVWQTYAPGGADIELHRRTSHGHAQRVVGHHDGDCGTPEGAVDDAVAEMHRHLESGPPCVHRNIEHPAVKAAREAEARGEDGFAAGIAASGAKLFDDDDMLGECEECLANAEALLRASLYADDAHSSAIREYLEARWTAMQVLVRVHVT